MVQIEPGFLSEGEPRHELSRRHVHEGVAHELLHQVGIHDNDGSALMKGHPSRDDMGQ